jgi:hypothetical protein
MSYCLLTHVTCTHLGDPMLASCGRNTCRRSSKPDLEDPTRYWICAEAYVVDLHRGRTQC